MIKFRCNKLGRDKSLQGFESEGLIAHYKILAGKELCHELKHKLIEEAEEVKDTQELGELTAELADVLEVIDGLCKAYGIDADELARIKEEKKRERGGFEEGFYVEAIEMDESSPKVKHFRASPEKYPED